MADITPLSHSRITLGNKCPYAFKKKYVNKTEKPAILTADILIRGTVFHEIVAEANKYCISKGEQVIMGNAVKIAPRYAAKLSDEYYEDVLHLCRNWDDYHMIENPETAKAEVKLAVDPLWQPIDYDSEDAFLRGRLDLVSIDGETAYVVDYKTNWQAQPEAEVLKSYQLGIYALMVFAHNPEVQIVNAYMDFVRVPIRRERILTREDLPDIEKRVRADFGNLSLMRKYPATTNSWCSGCQYIGKCPAYVGIDKGDTIVSDDKQATKLASKLLGLEELVKTYKASLKAWIVIHGDVKAGDRILGFKQSTGVTYDVPTALKGLLKAKINPDNMAQLFGMPSTTVKTALKRLDDEKITEIVTGAAVQTGGSTFKFFKPPEGE